MKNIYKIIAIVIFAFIQNPLKSQDNIDVFLEGNINDANLVMKEYIEPLILGFSNSINNGWYNTAKPHKTFGFDISVTASAAMIPSDAEFFTLPAGLNTISLTDPSSNTQLPTILGAAEKAPELRFTDENSGLELIRISSPPGLGLEDEIGFNVVPVPMVQVGIGLFKKTDLKIRYIPTTKLGDGEFDLIGFGLMHSLKQWIPGIKEAPVDISLFAGYTKLESRVDLSDGGRNPGGEGIFNVDAFTVQGLISKKLSVLTLYGGVGYNSAKSSLKLNGQFEVERNIGSVTDPIDLSFDTSGFRTSAGFRLKLAILTIHADYSVQEYNTLTAGVGIAIR